MAAYNKVLLAALCVLAVSTLCQAHPQGFITQPANAAQTFAQPGVAAGQGVATQGFQTAQQASSGFTGQAAGPGGFTGGFGSGR